MVKQLLIILCFTVIKTNAQSVGGVTSGAATYCTSVNSGFITLSGHTGMVLDWQFSINAGVSWNNTSNITTAQSYVNLTQTTHYRAIVQDGAFPSDTSSVSIITINPPAVGGTISGAGSFCVNSGAGTLNLTGQAGNVLNWLVSTNNGVSWTVINNTTTILNHSNISQNTLYAAVVENVPTCPIDTSSFVSFVINPLTVAGNFIESDTIVCSMLNDDTINLISNVGDVVNWLSSIDSGVTWNPIGNTTNTLSYLGLTQTIWYQTVVQSGVCTSDTTAQITVTVALPNPVDAGTDETITQFETIKLDGFGVGSPVWSPSIDLDDPNIFMPIAKPNFTTLYTIMLTDSNFCVSTDTVTITVKVPFPNAITPNGDGANDFFIIDQVDSLSNNSISIYNRYGNVVFDESPYTNGWNGKSLNGSDLPDGIYYYSFDFGDGRETRTGYILIKR